MASNPRHPLLADTSSLIAVANTDQWDVLAESLALTRSIRRLVDDHGYDIDVVGPPYLLYVLFDNGLISKAEFCEATGEMIRTEGWTGYEVVKNAWASIPVDCSEFLDVDILPQ
jgi:hypothetical protein